MKFLVDEEKTRTIQELTTKWEQFELLTPPKLWQQGNVQGVTWQQRDNLLWGLGYAIANIVMFLATKMALKLCFVMSFHILVCIYFLVLFVFSSVFYREIINE